MSTLPDIVNEECVERLIEHEAEPSALLCLETHSEFTISGRVRVSEYSNWFSVGGGITIRLCIYIVLSTLKCKFGKCVLFRQGQ